MARGAVRAAIAFLAVGLLSIRSAPAPAPDAAPLPGAMPLLAVATAEPGRSRVSGEGHVPAAWPSAEAAYGHGTPQMVRALLDRSRLLQDARFQVPQGLYQRYLRETSQGPIDEPSDVPVAFIAEDGAYRLSVGADLQARITAELSIRVFDPKPLGKCPVLSAALAWENVTVNGKPAQLASADGWLLLPGGLRGEGVSPSRAEGILPSGVSSSSPSSSVSAASRATRETEAEEARGRDALATKNALAPSILYTITAEAPLSKASALGGSAALDVCRTARTLVLFDSPGTWQVQVAANQSGKGGDSTLGPSAEFPPLEGAADKGTHGQVALSPRGRLQVDYRPPQAHSEHASRYELRGDIAWNLEAAVEQVSAVLNVTVAGGPSDRLELLLPDRAARVSIEGPEVREVRTAAGRATVYLRGKILGSTVLRVSYEMPAGSSAQRDFGRLGITEGHWLGGSLAASAGGGEEVQPGASAGLRELPLSSLPPSTASLLTGPAALAYEITARDFSLSVEELQLGQFALKQSIADLAHYEVFLDRDGSILGRVRYEVRNREKQFLRVQLPADARILLARVNEKSCPATLVRETREEGKEGERGRDALATRGQDARATKDALATWLLPLERSRASVKGLVSFPVDLVYVCRGAALAAGAGRPYAPYRAEVPLPAIDLPVAYGWCEAYLPQNLAVKKWTGPLSAVEKFSSETATASLDYGYGELAEGYKLEDRPEYKAPPPPPPPPPELKKSGGGLLALFGAKSPEPADMMLIGPAAPPGPASQPGSARFTRGDGSTPAPVLRPAQSVPYVTNSSISAEAATAPATQPSVPILGDMPATGNLFTSAGKPVDEKQAQSSLARNYYRVGKEFYDKGDYEKAAENLKEVQRLAPGSTEADNALRLSSNILMVQGKSGAAQGQAEKAAAREVQKEVSQQNRELVLRQDTLLTEGREALRAGRQDEARSKLQVAQALGQEVLTQDPGNVEVAARTELSGEELGKLGRQTTAQTAGLRQQLEQFKQQRQFDQALDVARKIRQAEGDNRQIQGEMENLAVASAREKSLQDEIKAKRQQLAEIEKKAGYLKASLDLRADQSKNHAAGEMMNLLTADLHVGESLGRADVGINNENIYNAGTAVTAGKGALDPRIEIAELTDRIRKANDQVNVMGLEKMTLQAHPSAPPAGVGGATHRFGNLEFESAGQSGQTSQAQQYLDMDPLLRSLTQDLVAQRTALDQFRRQGGSDHRVMEDVQSRIDSLERQVADRERVVRESAGERLKETSALQLALAGQAAPQGEQPPAPSPITTGIAANARVLNTITSKLTLNFQDAPIRTVLNTIAEAGGFTVIEDLQGGRVEGRITLTSATPVTITEAISLLDTALKQKGYAAIHTDNALTIVPSDAAKRTLVPVRMGADPNQIGTTDRWVTQIIPIKTVDAAKLKGDLASRTPGSLDVATNAANNSLIVTGPEGEIQRLAEIIAAVDVQPAQATVVKTFDLNYAKATAVARLITDIFKEGESGGARGARGVRGGAVNELAAIFGAAAGGAGGSAGRGGRPGANVTASAEDSTNKLVVSAPAELMDEIKSVIDELDKNPIPAASVRIYPLKSSKAKDVADALNRMYSQEEAGGRVGAGSPGVSASFVADADTNSLLVTTADTDENRKRIEAVIAKLDEEAPAAPSKGAAGGFAGPRMNLNMTTGSGNAQVATGGGGIFGGGGGAGAGQEAAGHRADDRLTVAYDIRDLLATAPQSHMGETPMPQAGEAAPAKSREETVRQITGLLKQSVAADSWADTNAAGRVGAIQETNGQLVVTQTADNQRAVASLLSNLREAKGPQVELGGNIAQQRASGVIQDGGANAGFYATLPGQAAAQPEAEKELSEFIRRNYDWAVQRNGNGLVQLPSVTIQDLSTTASVPEGGTLLLGGQKGSGQLETEEGAPVRAGGRFLDDVQADFIAQVAEGQRARAQGAPRLAMYNGQGAYVTIPSRQAYVSNVTPVIAENEAAFTPTVTVADQSGSLVNRLQYNLGQKVVVNSMNLSGDAQTASALGVNWNRGNNGVTYAVVDEAVLRSLQEMDAQAQRRGQFVNANGRVQETIVGTGALLANGMVGNLAFAGERGNSFDVNDNTVEVPHEKVLLVTNGGYLTAVKAGAMQHWTQRAAPVTFGEVPQTIEPPRVGRLVKFEKRLLEPTDRMVIGIEYTMEGESK